MFFTRLLLSGPDDITFREPPAPRFQPPSTFFFPLLSSRCPPPPLPLFSAVDPPFYLNSTILYLPLDGLLLLKHLTCFLFFFVVLFFPPASVCAPHGGFRGLGSIHKTKQTQIKINRNALQWRKGKRPKWKMDVLTLSLHAVAAAAPVAVLPDVRLKIAPRAGAGEGLKGGVGGGGWVW